MIAKINRKRVTNGPQGQGLNLHLQDLTPHQFRVLGVALKQWSNGHGYAHDLFRALEKIWPENIEKPL